MNINHLNVRQSPIDSFGDGVRCETCGSSPRKISQSCVETISQKRNKNMSFDSLFQLMPDGTDGKPSLQILKCLLNAGQKQIRFPDGFRRSGLHVGTKQIASLTPQRSPQAFTVQFEMEREFIHRFLRIWDGDTNQPKVSPGFFL